MISGSNERVTNYLVRNILGKWAIACSSSRAYTSVSDCRAQLNDGFEVLELDLSLPPGVRIDGSTLAARSTRVDELYVL